MLSSFSVCYLFLGGTGAGACFVLAVLGLMVPQELVAVAAQKPCKQSAHLVFCAPARYRLLFFCAYAAALVLLLLGMVCLLADAGRPEQVILLVTQPSPSFVSVGAWALAVGIFLAAVLAALWGNILKRLRFMFVRLLEVIVAIVAIVVMAYTGLLLQSLHAVPFWATPWLPVLFTLSSLSCGIAIVLGTAQFSGADQVFRTVLQRLVIVDAAVIVLECIAAMGFLMPIVSTSDSAWLGVANGSILAASSAASDLLTGQNAPFFWGGFVLVGLIVPLVLEVAVVLGRRVSSLTTIAMVSSVLVGGFVMRFCVVEAGIHPMLAIVATG